MHALHRQKRALQIIVAFDFRPLQRGRHRNIAMKKSDSTSSLTDCTVYLYIAQIRDGFPKKVAVL